MSDGVSEKKTSWVEVVAGEFVMGAYPDSDCLTKGLSDKNDKPHWDEAPPHKVNINHSFRIARAPVSQEQYAVFYPQYKKTLAEYGVAWEPDAPAVMLTWDDAVGYCQQLARATGESVRLPTEAEWEYTAHNAGTLGLDGMGADIYEWCLDWWAPYPDKPVADPVGPDAGTTRVIRGGRPANRAGSIPGDRRTNLGFRPVVGLVPDGDKTPVPARPRVFVGINPEPRAWNSDVISAPVYTEPVPFIHPPENLLELPYWNRQHVPSVTWCPNGDLLATVFTAPKDNSSQMAVLLARLRYGATVWDPPIRFFIAPDHNVTTGALYTDSEGVIHHYNGLGGFDCLNFSLLRRVSTDNGATWSELEIVREHDFGYRGPGMDTFLLSDGTLAMPTDGEKFCGTILYVSSDNGLSWVERTGQLRFRRKEVFANSDASLAKNPFDAVDSTETPGRWNVELLYRNSEKGHWMAGIHAQPVELADGGMLAIGRGDNLDDCSPLSVSRDGGETWTYSPSPFPPIGSGQRATMRRLAEGPILYLSFTDMKERFLDDNPRGIPVTCPDGREKRIAGLFAALSLDDGKTWKYRKLLPIGEERRFPTEEPGHATELAGYLSCVQSPDGMIHMVSSYRYYRFNLAWLTSS